MILEQHTAQIMEDVVRTMFRNNDPGALTRARQLIEKYRSTVGVVAMACYQRAYSIEQIIREEQPHWTPREEDTYGYVPGPTPETMVRSRKCNHDPIKTLRKNRRITRDQMWAAQTISWVYEEMSRLGRFKAPNLGETMGTLPKRSGKGPALTPIDIAVEHALVYIPWANAVHSSKNLSLPIIIEVVVFNTALRRFSGRHATLVTMVKGALDLYVEMGARVTPADRDDLAEQDTMTDLC